MDNLYKYAAQNALHFPSIKGELLVEQLFSLPLTSRNGFDLDSVAKAVNAELKTNGEESFVATSANPKQKTLEAMLEIVKDVISTKQAENAAVVARQKRTEERARLLDIITNKENEALSAASLDDLKKKLAELDG